MSEVEETQIFICGRSIDHFCNGDGPHIYGGIDDDGDVFITKDSTRKRITWGSVSCSICGKTAYENSFSS